MPALVPRTLSQIPLTYLRPIHFALRNNRMPSMGLGAVVVENDRGRIDSPVCELLNSRTLKANRLDQSFILTPRARTIRTNLGLGSNPLDEPRGSDPTPPGTIAPASLG